MKLFQQIFLCTLFIAPSVAIAQEKLASKEAFEKYHELHELIRTEKIKLSDELYWAYYFEIDDLVQQITHHHELVLLHYYTYAYNCRYLGLPKEAIKLYNQFFEYYDKHNSSFTLQEKAKFSHYRAQSYGYLADMYAKASLLDSASSTHKKNIKFTQKLKNLNRASALNNYGLFFYWTKKKLDSALFYFNESLNLTKTIEPIDHLLGSVRDNIADIYVEKGLIGKANSLYQENFKFYQVSKNKGSEELDDVRLAAAGVQLINTSIDLKRFEQANEVLQEMQTIFTDTSATITLNPSSRLLYLQAKERVLLAQEKTQDAYNLSKQVKQLSDSIIKIATEKKSVVKNAISDVTLQRLKATHDTEKQLKENKIQNQRLKLWMVSITSIAVLGFLVSLFLRRRQHITNARNKQQIAELKNEKLNTEIASKQRDLSDFAINLNQNQEWAKELATKLDQLKSTKGRERKKLFDAFEKDIQNKITFDGDTKTFYQRLDTLSDAFYSELQASFPDLSKTERRLCSLIRLKIGSHEIATLQNITVASLHTSRYRLRKKLNLSKDNDLDVFIQRL